MLNPIDRLASGWLSWRTRRSIPAGAIKPVTIEEFVYRNGRLHLLAEHEVLATFADSMVRLLEGYEADNFLVIDMAGRAGSGHKYPIRITLQYAHRESPAEVVAQLRRACEDVVRLANAGAPAGELRGKAAYALALCGYSVPRKEQESDGASTE